MKKYVFKPYSKIFPELFLREKERISSRVKMALAIEHIGSTSVPNLGGKGIIDIAIAVYKQDMDSVSQQLQSLGPPSVPPIDSILSSICLTLKREKEDITFI